VSDTQAGEKQGHRGQGLFVAKTYMAKMGGTVDAANVDDGVEFVLTLALA
jgi:sensor histidine kinase regulating citrate/malate metabolism